MQTPSEVTNRLELFRSQTLTNFEPVDKKDTAVSAIDSYMDNLIGLENFQVPEMPSINSRAGMYIYLNAAVRHPLPSTPTPHFRRTLTGCSLWEGP